MLLPRGVRRPVDGAAGAEAVEQRPPQPLPGFPVVEGYHPAVADLAHAAEAACVSQVLGALQQQVGGEGADDARLGPPPRVWA